MFGQSVVQSNRSANIQHNDQQKQTPVGKYDQSFLAYVLILLLIFHTDTSIDQKSRRLTTPDFIQTPFSSLKLSPYLVNHSVFIFS